MLCKSKLETGFGWTVSFHLLTQGGVSRIAPSGNAADADDHCESGRTDSAGAEVKVILPAGGKARWKG